MAKSLFQKGADFVSAMVFMFASTNLVIELGIVTVTGVAGATDPVTIITPKVA